MTETIKPIQTRYKGYRFRSRTEARWARFFDACGIKWEYEKEGYSLPSGPYLADFWIPNPMWDMPNAGYFVEIKGQMPTDEELRHCEELTDATFHRCHILVGAPGDFRWLERSYKQEWIENRIEVATHFPHLAGVLHYSLTHRVAKDIDSAIEAALSERFGERSSGKKEKRPEVPLPEGWSELSAQEQEAELVRFVAQKRAQLGIVVPPTPPTIGMLLTPRAST